MEKNITRAQRIESLLLAMEQIVTEQLDDLYGKASRIELVQLLGLKQPTYPAINSRRFIEKSWLAQILLARLEQRGAIVQSKLGVRTIISST